MNCFLLKYSEHWLLPKKQVREWGNGSKNEKQWPRWNVARQWNVSTMGMKGKAENISLGEMCPGAQASHSGTWMGRASIQQRARLCLHNCKDTGMHVSCMYHVSWTRLCLHNCKAPTTGLRSHTWYVEAFVQFQGPGKSTLVWFLLKVTAVRKVPFILIFWLQRTLGWIEVLRLFN